jgi:hypothetical protein
MCWLKQNNLECKPSIAGFYSQKIQIKDSQLNLIMDLTFNLQVST